MINYLSKPFIWFFKLEAASGLVLLFAAIIALIISNSGLSELYFSTLNQYLFIGINNFGLKLSVLHWINDALMAIFFFFVTLEIKREQICSIHPFVFCHGNAHEALQNLHPATDFYALSLIRCSGFSGGPTGECSRTISEQIARLSPNRRPRYIIADSQAIRDVVHIGGYRRMPKRQLTRYWGWPPVSALCRL